MRELQIYVPNHPLTMFLYHATGYRYCEISDEAAEFKNEDKLLLSMVLYYEEEVGDCISLDTLSNVLSGIHSLSQFRERFLSLPDQSIAKQYFMKSPYSAKISGDDVQRKFDAVLSDLKQRFHVPENQNPSTYDYEENVIH